MICQQPQCNLIFKALLHFAFMDFLIIPNLDYLLRLKVMKIDPFHLQLQDLKRIGLILLKLKNSNTNYNIHQRKYKVQLLDLNQIVGQYNNFHWMMIHSQMEIQYQLTKYRFLNAKINQTVETFRAYLKKEMTNKKEYIFFQILPGIVELANDIFRNYVVQRILEQGNQIQRDLIFDQLSKSILILSYNTYGCRVAQKLLEISYNNDKFVQMFTILQSQIRNLVVDINGNHVIQKIAELIRSQKIDWLIEGVFGQIQKLSNYSHGCRLIQQILEQSTMPQVQFCLILTNYCIYKELLAFQDELCFSQYGNYIIKIALERTFRSRLEDTKQHYQKFRKTQLRQVWKVMIIVLHHSNVVDKSINISSVMRKEILKVFINNMNVFYRLSNNCYGNYVKQNFCKQLDYNQLLKIYPEASQLNTQFGQHLLQTLQKLKN